MRCATTCLHPWICQHARARTLRMKRRTWHDMTSWWVRTCFLQLHCYLSRMSQMKMFVFKWTLAGLNMPDEIGVFLFRNGWKVFPTALWAMLPCCMCHSPLREVVDPTYSWKKHPSTEEPFRKRTWNTWIIFQVVNIQVRPEVQHGSPENDPLEKEIPFGNQNVSFQGRSRVVFKSCF